MDKLKWWHKVWLWISNIPTLEEVRLRSVEILAIWNIYCDAYFATTGRYPYDLSRKEQEALTYAMEARERGIVAIQKWVALQMGITQQGVSFHLVNAKRKLATKNLYLSVLSLIEVDRAPMQQREKVIRLKKYQKRRECAGAGLVDCQGSAPPGKYLCHPCYKFFSGEYGTNIKLWPVWLQERARMIDSEMRQDAIAEVQHVEYFEDAA